MTTFVTQLKTQVDAFRRTNAFTPGDQASFSIPLLRGEVELPGKYDPKDYLLKVQISDLTGKRVAVMFPGNGGLCVEALNLGADDVWAIEPRNNYIIALATLSAWTAQIKARGFTTAMNLNEFVNLDGKFDLVIWSEGLETLKNPIATLTGAWKLLAPGGKFIIEVVHGQQGLPSTAMNQWLPKEEVFLGALKQIVGDAPARSMNGRLQRRMIYEAVKPVPPAPKKEEFFIAQKPIAPVNPPTIAVLEPPVGPTLATEPVAEVKQEVPVLEPQEPVETQQIDQTQLDAHEVDKPKRVNMKKKRG